MKLLDKRAQKREYDAAYYQANREKRRAYSAEFYRTNRDVVAAKQAAYRAANPESVSITNAVTGHRSRAIVSDLTVPEWREILTASMGRCAYCNRDDRTLQIDHVVPISRGGHHTKTNVVPSCAPCNSSKGTKLLEEWTR